MCSGGVLALCVPPAAGAYTSQISSMSASERSTVGQRPSNYITRRPSNYITR